MISFYVNMDIFIQEPAEVYHAKAAEYLSSHQLMDFMKCPLLYYKKRMREIQEQPTTSFLLGQAAHVRILEGRADYENQFAVGGPINPTTGKPYGSLTKKFAEWREQQSRPVLTVEQAELIEKMASGVAGNEHAVDLISYGVAEGVVRTKYHEMPCQIRLDWFNPRRGIVDLKTCDDLMWFEADARRYRYANQLSFYNSVLHELVGDFVPTYLVAVEKKEPFRCGVWRISDDYLAMAMEENEQAMDQLMTCQAGCIWPTGYEVIRSLDVP